MSRGRGPAPDEAKRARIRELRAQGWTLAAIGSEVGISRQRVDQILNPGKAIARRRAKDAVERGDLAKPTACEACGRKLMRLFKHHADYSKPLEVRWLCGRCHVLAEPVGRIGGARHLGREWSMFRQQRIARNLTVDSLAVSAGLSLKTIHGFDRGVMPKLDQGVAVASAMGVTPSELASWFARKPHPNARFRNLSDLGLRRKWLSSARVNRGLSQKGLARIVGVSAVAVCGWEGGRSVPSDKHRDDLAAALGIRRAQLDLAFVTNRIESQAA